jgi:hypothetical protein
MTEVCFVLAPGQNHFFVEVAEAVGIELERLGVPATLSNDGFPPLREDLVYAIVSPHEFQGLAPPEHWPTPRQLERTVLYCLEQPGTKYFEGDVRIARSGVGAVLDINPLGVQELRRDGVDAHHAPIGWTEAWTFAQPQLSETARDIDLLHLGVYSTRRGEILERASDRLARRRTALVLGDPSKPNTAAEDDFTVGAEKWDLLARSRVLLNIHQGDRPYFEWLRVIQAICNGAFVVTEHSTGTEPLVEGEHFASAAADDMVELAEVYLDDESRRASAARAAYDCLRDRLPLSASAELLAGLAAEVALRPPVAPAGDARVDWPDNAGIRAEVAAAAYRSRVALRDPAARLRRAFPFRDRSPSAS